MESESIVVRLNKELHQRLKDLAAWTGRSKSFYVKRAIAIKILQQDRQIAVF